MRSSLLHTNTHDQFIIITTMPPSINDQRSRRDPRIHFQGRAHTHTLTTTTNFEMCLCSRGTFSSLLALFCLDTLCLCFMKSYDRSPNKTSATAYHQRLSPHSITHTHTHMCVCARRATKQSTRKKTKQKRRKLHSTGPPINIYMQKLRNARRRGRSNNRFG